MQFHLKTIARNFFVISEQTRQLTTHSVYIKPLDWRCSNVTRIHLSRPTPEQHLIPTLNDKAAMETAVTDNDHRQTANQSSQSVVVLRHGDRLDNFDPLWVKTASRPWDPPLVDQGLVRAFSTGRILRNKLKYPIHRVFVSPFVRCVQTASEAISALCAIDDDPAATTSHGVPIDPSKIKVAVEYGLCEMLNKEAIRIDNAPKDGNFRFNLSEIEALLPAGTVDRTFKRVYEELPQWEETVLGARNRYEHVVKALADKYPSENLLLVTHGEGVGVSVSSILKDVMVYEVDYCAYSELKRSIVQEDQSYTPGEFEVVDHPGVKYYSSTTTGNGAVDDGV